MQNDTTMLYRMSLFGLGYTMRDFQWDTPFFSCFAITRLRKCNY